MALEASTSSLVFITSGVMGAKTAWLLRLLTSAVQSPLVILSDKCHDQFFLVSVLSVLLCPSQVATCIANE